MEKFLNQMERKFGKYAVKNLMFYIIGIYMIGAIIGLMNPLIYYSFLSLNVEAILRGQVWRLVTFVFEPMGGTAGSGSFLFFLISMYFYFIIGGNLEFAWGTFRFNLYYLSGLILNVIAAFITYFVTGNAMTGAYFGLNYVNESLLLAYCAMYPNMQVLLMFVLPIKVKYLGIFYGGMILLQVIQMAAGGNYFFALSIIVAMLNFLIFFFVLRGNKRSRGNFRKMKMDFNPFPKGGAGKRPHEAKVVFRNERGISRHKCAICGRTEHDDPNLEFRFCSKCDGNFEYCSDHLYTHQHVKRQNIE